MTAMTTMTAKYNHGFHPFHLDASALLCKQALKMVVANVCPHCGMRAWHDFYGLTCWTCGWAQYN